MRWSPALLGLALLLACSAGPSSSGDAGRSTREDASTSDDANAATCAAPGTFQCNGGTAEVCCDGRVCEVLDGPCGPRPPLDPDAGAGADGGVCAMTPSALGCPCTVGATTCVWYQQRMCVDGAWTDTTARCGIVELCGFCR